jgi:hypothetical protein
LCHHSVKTTPSFCKARLHEQTQNSKIHNQKTPEITAQVLARSLSLPDMSQPAKTNFRGRKSLNTRHFKHLQFMPASHKKVVFKSATSDVLFQ